MKKICYSCLCAVIVIALITTSIPISAATDTSPIVFVPGMMGSRLFSSPDLKPSSMIWPPSVSSIFSFADKLEMDNEVYTVPPINMTKDGAKREYGSLSSYKDIIDRLCTEFDDREVYFFSYDFRQSNEETAKELAEFIDSLDADTVSLVSHSMGGLVTALYASEYGYGKIEKLVACGAPYEGAPALLNKVCSDDLLATSLDDDLIGKLLQFADVLLDRVFGLDRNLKTSFPACAELAPSYDYLDTYPMYKSASLVPTFFMPSQLVRYRPMSQSASKSIYRTLFRSSYTTANSTMKKLDAGYKALTEADNAYFICGTSQPTITSLKLSGYSKNTIRIDDIIFDYSGDGTVPLDSSSIMSSLKKEDDNVLYLNTDHGGTCTSAKAMDYICDILRGGSSSVQDDTQDVTSFKVYKLGTEKHAEIVSDGEVLVSSEHTQAAGAACVVADGNTYFCVPASADCTVVTEEKCEMTVKTFKN